MIIGPGRKNDNLNQKGDKRYMMKWNKRISDRMRFILSVLLLLTVSVIMTASDWPQYLGPNRDGKSNETGLARSWPSRGPQVLWEHKLGEGFGGAAIKDGRVYILDRIDSKEDVLRCYDLSSGKELWTFENSDPGSFDYNGSRPTPTLDNAHLYTVGPMGSVYCINLKTHKLRWKREFKIDFQAERPFWAYSQSPLLVQDLVIVAPQCEKAGVVAYHKETGDIVWKSERLCHDPGYSSPSLVTIDGMDQIVQVTPFLLPEMIEEEEDEEDKDEGPRFPGGGVYGMDPKTGKILWNFRDFYCGITIPPVTDIGDGRLFVTAGYESSATMLKISKKGNGFSVNVLFKNDDIKSQIHPAILYENHLYLQANGDDNRDGLMCLALDGKVLWKTGRRPHFEWGGFIIADDLLYMMEGNKGDLYMIEPNPGEYKVLAKARLLKRPLIWAPLALSDGKLVIRDQKQIKCVSLK